MIIHKVGIPLRDVRGVNKITVPAGAKILSAMPQAGSIAIWYEFDEKNLDLDAYNVRVYITGEGFSRSAKDIYLDTVQFITPNGQYVLHVYLEKINV